MSEYHDHLGSNSQTSEEDEPALKWDSSRFILFPIKEPEGSTHLNDSIIITDSHGTVTI